VSTWRWNAASGKYDILYAAGDRDYPQLSPVLQAQLHAIEPTHDGMIEYFPCMVQLANGEQHDCIYVVDAKSYIRVWGAWPDEDRGKRALAVQDVVEIHPSPSRLPVQFARQMYAIGESAMGYCIFALQFADGTRQVYCTGNLMDFLEFPEGKSVRDVVALTPNQGERERSLGTREYYWCLFGARPQ
jgi:hypothetical protein